jgi:hypothetical protein
MFEVSGQVFYFDLNEISDIMKIDSDKINIDELLSKEDKKEMNDIKKIKDDNYPLIDVAKWELTKALIETVLHEQGVVDEQMGITKLGEQLSIPFRLSFNTLLMNKIIKQK